MSSLRVLPADPLVNLDDYIAAGGMRGLEAARAVSWDTVVAELEASGLRGRGGAGFPTGRKWRTVRSFASGRQPTTVIVNAAEGEPGTFKDRSILRTNPFAVLEGALIAAHAVEARRVMVALKAKFEPEIAIMRSLMAELSQAGYADDIEMVVIEGPSEYLFGEETALLEVVDGRPPLPRIAPPYRRGVDEVAVDGEDVIDPETGLANRAQLAEPDGQSDAPPVLVNNVETMANVPGIIANGAAWFRSVGTDRSPGTLVCTVTGDVVRPAVAEVPLGMTLREVIDQVGGGLRTDSKVRGVLVGVSGAVVLPDQLDTPLTYENMSAIGSALGSGSYIVFDESTHPLSVTAGVSRFLAIESCGQCTGCKQDGLEISMRLQRLAEGAGTELDMQAIDKRLSTVADGARCSIGRQHETVVGSLVAAFRAEIARVDLPLDPIPVATIAALLDINESGAQIDETFVDKQPDWTYDEIDSGKTPVERFTDHRSQPAS